MKTRCPHCKACFNISDSHLGKKAKCSKCQQGFVVTEYRPQAKNNSAASKPNTRKENKPERDNTVSVNSKICANCDCPIGKLEQAYSYNGNIVCSACNQKLNSQVQSSLQIPTTVPMQVTTLASEETLKIIHPAMVRNRPILFFLCCILCLFGVGFLILLIWHLQCRCTTLTITTKRSTLRYGILSKNTSEVRHCDIRNLIVEQGILQRLFNVGIIAISSAGQADVEIDISGVPSPQQIADLIRQYQN